MRQYLLDSAPLAGYLHGRQSFVDLIIPLIREHQAATSILVVWLNNSAGSRRGAIVIAQEPTQAFATPDLSGLAPKVWLGCNELVGEALMVALGMIVGQILVDHSTINRWVLKYTPRLEKEFRRRKRPVGTSWL